MGLIYSLVDQIFSHKHDGYPVHRMALIIWRMGYAANFAGSPVSKTSNKALCFIV